jgi:hypothetical protein
MGVIKPWERGPRLSGQEKQGDRRRNLLTNPEPVFPEQKMSGNLRITGWDFLEGTQYLNIYIKIKHI